MLAKGERVRYRVAFAGASGAAGGMPKGTPVAKLVEFAEKFGVARPGQVGYDAKVSRGKLVDNNVALTLDAQLSAVEVKIAKAAMPGLVPAVVEGLNDNWSVQLLDRARPWPNHRELPVRDGRAYAELDLVERDADLFVGHPVVAGNREVKLQVSWASKGRWYVEAHNPTDRPIKTKLSTSPGWTVFRFAEEVELPPGQSRTWWVKELP